MPADVTSIAWCLARCRLFGLRCEPRGTAVLSWDGGWRPDPQPWLRAPAHESRVTNLFALDAGPDSVAARVWVSEACADPSARLVVLRRWPELQRGTSSDASAAIERVNLLWGLLDSLRPTPAIVDATIKAVVAEHVGAQVATVDPETPVNVERAAEALGVPVEAVRGMVKRGEVRRVKVGSRWAIPLSEVERIASIGFSDGLR